MRLRMRERTDPAEDLPVHDGVMYTGAMGDCVCVIALWNFDHQTQSYQNVRGHHGGGGATGVNIASVLNGVPDQLETMVCIMAGPNNSAVPRAVRDFQRHVKALLPGPTRVIVKYNVGEGFVNRAGAIFPP
jgi:hypothetical protein